MEEKLTGQRRLVRDKLTALDHAADDVDTDGGAQPGKSVDPKTLKVSDTVLVAGIRQQAVVRRIASGEVGAATLIEVAAGHLLLKVRCDQLLMLGDGKKPLASALVAPPAKSKAKGASPQIAVQGVTGSGIEPVIPSPTNSIDLRGKDVESALSAAWSFIDKAVLRGDHLLVVIHGHGTDRLKRALRQDLKERSPYPLRFRGGEDHEGGDGVTVIKLGD